MTLQAAAATASGADPLAALRTLAARYLGRFMHPPGGAAERVAMCAALRPLCENGDDDYALAFGERGAARARFGYRALWAGEPVFAPAPGQTRLSVAVAFSDELGRATPRSRAFPEGYRKVAPLLRPGRVWVSWAFVEESGAGTVFDGLVFLGRRWAWFPQPWRFMAAESPALAAPSPMAFWAE